ncbi:aldo/keto reductase [Streptomyces sp. NPDC048594]|uniref:aldo/keto reductase n=1 Tax=Streptomyces sp. NPDC048594 TaxID=3365575 RepID=UPI003722A3E2
MIPAPPAGPITIAGKTVSRLGFGTMRLTGRGTWADPDDRLTALTVLRRAVHTHGISHIDTADAYGPHTVEQLPGRPPRRPHRDRHRARSGRHLPRRAPPLRRPPPTSEQAHASAGAPHFSPHRDPWAPPVHRPCRTTLVPLPEGLAVSWLVHRRVSRESKDHGEVSGA